LDGSQRQSGLLEKREISAPAKTWTWECSASPQSTTILILTDVSHLKLQHTQTLNFEPFVTFLCVYSAFRSIFQFEKYNTVQPTITSPQFKITLHLMFNFSAPKLIISEINFPHLQFLSVFKSTTSNECARFQIITAVMMHMKVCLDVMPCQLVKQFKMDYLTLQMEAPHSSSKFCHYITADMA